jgi:hypothetical protein
MDWPGPGVDRAAATWADVVKTAVHPEPVRLPHEAVKAWRRRRDTASRDALWSAACLELTGNMELAQAIAAAATSCRDELCDHAGDACLWWKEWRGRRARERQQGREADAVRFELAAKMNVAKRRARGPFLCRCPECATRNRKPAA